jgi:hypothetical protein
MWSEARAIGGLVFVEAAPSIITVLPEFSLARKENRSRTVWITFHCRGITSSVSVIVSPSLHSLSEPQHGQFAGAGTTTRSRGRYPGKGWCDGRLCVFR